MTARRRRQLFAAITVGALATILAVVAAAALRSPRQTSAPDIRVRIASGTLLAVDLDRRHAAQFNRVVLVSAADPRGARAFSGLNCQRVAFAAGTGLCLGLRHTFPVRTYAAELFDATGKIRSRVGLQGFPSRGRVSPGGRYATSTSFISGDSYTDPGAFSTRAVIYDGRTGRAIANLEQFTVRLGGQVIHRPDFNFWGVTFAGDSGRFYATLGTGSHHYLIDGDVTSRTATVVRDGVECPSLSPDGRRIAFKARVGSPFRWRIHVLDLANGRETALPESHSIDDQVEWLDDRTLAYDVDETVVTVRADGTGEPRLLMPAANSPAIVR